MVLIAARDSLIGATGAIVSITSHQDARGAIPGEGMEARFTRSAIGLIGRPILLFQSKPRFWPGKQTISGTVRLKANVGSPSPRRWIWMTYFWSRRRKAWRCWERAPRPTLFALVGWRAITESWRSMGSSGCPHIPRRRDSALAMRGLVRDILEEIAEN